MFHEVVVVVEKVRSFFAMFFEAEHHDSIAGSLNRVIHADEVHHGDCSESITLRSIMIISTV